MVESGEKLGRSRSRSAAKKRGEAKYGSTPTQETKKSVAGVGPERRR